MSIIIKSFEGNVRNVARNATTVVDWRLEVMRLAEDSKTAQNAAPKIQSPQKKNSAKHPKPKAVLQNQPRETAKNKSASRAHSSRTLILLFCNSRISSAAIRAGCVTMWSIAFTLSFASIRVFTSGPVLSLLVHRPKPCCHERNISKLQQQQQPCNHHELLKAVLQLRNKSVSHLQVR